MSDGEYKATRYMQGTLLNPHMPRPDVTLPPRIGTRDAELTARIAALEAALQACADDLEAYVNAEYPISLRDQHPAVYEPQYARDMQPVVNARAVLGAGQ